MSMLYILLRRPTNSRGGTPCVSSLNLPITLALALHCRKWPRGVFRRVVAIQVFLHVFIEIVRFNMVAEAVGVCEKQLRPIAVLLYKHIIMKVIHHKLAKI